MLIDFSATDLKEQPVIVLRNADGTAIQTLGYAHNLSMSLCYNETSTITFELPAYVDGIKTPHYDDVIGMRIIDVVGWGQFILVNPSIEKTGIKEIKSCKAYSLEYELTFKKISLSEDTYNFWNPTTPDETVLGILLSYLPSWSAGTVDSSLVGKYRTFSGDNLNLYNFIKSTVQQTYNCIFDFDTYERTISVRSVASGTNTSPVYISLSNLAKEISINEDTENIITRLDVSGADGVDIRSVNPMGSNKLYNLDYFMNATHFSQEMLGKWSSWEQSFDSHQLEYYNTSVERALKTSAILTEKAALAVLEGEDLAELENSQAVCIEYLASLTDTTSGEYITYQNRLADINAQIAAKNSEINTQKSVIAGLEAEKEDLTQELLSIQNEVSFANFFDADELVVLDRYFKEDSIQDSSFVVSNVESYSGTGESDAIANLTLVFSGGTVTKILGVSGKDLFSISGGTLYCEESANILSANVISGSFERVASDGSFVLSAYLGSGTLNTVSFPSGCISLTGSCSVVTSNVVPDITAPNSYATGSLMSFDVTTAKMYFTRNTTEYERYAVEWELFEYGKDCLEKLANPSFTFSVSVANFFALDEFISFATHLSLGQKIYLDIDEGNVLQPILIGAEINFEDLSSMSLSFGDKYNLSDSTFKLVDLLDQSISMGKTVDTSKLNYNSFIDSGASTAVKQFMESALDVSKNAILSGGDMAISWDGSGIKCRKLTSPGVYENEQLAIINNNICFTDDGWQTAKMAIGKFTDKTLGDSWGIVAPNIVGTLLAGQNLVIESEKKDGDISVFKVDADGAVLHNARFDIENGVTHIMLDPVLGFGIGTYPVVTEVDDVESWDEDNAKFWVDTEGNVHFKGTLEGCTGLFSGELKVGGDTGFRVDTQGNLSIGGAANNPNFHVTANGVLTAKSGSFTGGVDASALKINGNNVLTNTGTGEVATNESKIASDYLDLGNIQLDGTTGNITLGGSIYITGNIQWSSTNSPVQVMYSQYSYGNPISYPSYWHTTFSASDLYASYSYDGGQSWTSAVKVVGTDGHDGYDGSDATVNDVNVFNVLTGGGTRFGIFNDSTSNRLYINANYIRTGTLDADLVTLASGYGGFCTGYGSTGVSTTFGSKMYGSNGVDGEQYFLVTNMGCRMTSGGADFYCAGSSIVASGEIETGSDARIKNSISYDMDKYDGFFMSLKPTHYKFNLGTSGRQHIGFIAQDVENSLLANGLTTQDFAGVVYHKLEEANKNGLTDEYRLRYTEFISLNTHMIQKLYRRVEELERLLQGASGN